MEKLKKLLPDVLVMVIFVVISVGYFFTPTMDGLVLTGDDHNAAISCNAETDAYYQRTGERSRWNNSLFSGMPTYQMSPSYDSTDALYQAQKVFKFWMPTYVGYFLFMLIGFYIMMRCFGFNQWMSALGSVLWALSSYYPIIIGAGHIWKLMTLAFIPPTIGGIWLCYRGKYLMGGFLTALFLALQILNNHVQMTYYFIIVIAAVALACLADALRQKNLRQWMMGSAVCIVAALLAVGINISNLYHTYEYSKETMRGKSELTQLVKSSENQTKDGLDRDYITAWSYGIDETLTLLVPNAKGGASKALSQNEVAMRKANAKYNSIYGQVGQYWGDQPGTSGPVYVGAFVLLLFVLGAMIVKSPLKWGLIIATLLSIGLSWGKNMMWFTNLWLDYVPMYDKFRTVASILVVAEFTIPLLAMMGLRELVINRDRLSDKISVLGCKMSYNACIITSVAVTAGVTLLVWIMPEAFVGKFLSQQEAEMFSSMVGKGQLPADLVTNLQAMRRAMLTSDAMRSLLIIIAGSTVLWLYVRRKLNATLMTCLLFGLCLFDLWGVDKRYLSDEMFSRPKTRKEYFKATEADNYILQDKEHHRVLDFSHSTFNDNTAGYYHHSIGGYHAAKLRRYQELIENHISTEMAGMQSMLEPGSDGRSYVVDSAKGKTPVLDMLDMKYMILPAQGGTVPAVNPYACGNAWFVGSLSYVDGADHELAGLYNLDTHTSAVADRKFADALGEAVAQDSTAFIRLTDYECNALTYESESTRDGVAVFSEIYYPGWRATVDGEEVPVGRVNYVLRAIRLPQGHHTIHFEFRPQSLSVTETIAWISLALLMLTALVAIYRQVVKG